MGNESSLVVVPNPTGITQVNIREFERYSIERYQKCPKHITIIRHADLEDDSELHCVLMDYVGPKQKQNLQKDFIVPGQEVIMVYDPTFGLFSIIRVSEKEGGPEFALVTSVQSFGGFLIPIEKLPINLFRLELQDEQ
ncbi:MAG: hypothetical protein WCT07_03855 [Candidatus Paceibacterota bacterium]|jgi:hypothetical protein